MSREGFFVDDDIAEAVAFDMEDSLSPSDRLNEVRDRNKVSKAKKNADAKDDAEAKEDANPADELDYSKPEDYQSKGKKIVRGLGKGTLIAGTIAVGGTIATAAATRKMGQDLADDLSNAIGQVIYGVGGTPRPLPPLPPGVGVGDKEKGYGPGY